MGELQRDLLNPRRGEEKVRLTKSLNDPGDNHAPDKGQDLAAKNPVSSEKQKRPLKQWQYAQVRPPEAVAVSSSETT